MKINKLTPQTRSGNQMRIITKISLITLTCTILMGCDVLKRVQDNQALLTRADIVVNGKKNKSEEVNALLTQKPNSKLFSKFPVRLHIYNSARPNRDSLFSLWRYSDPKRAARLTKFYSNKQLNQIEDLALSFNDWLRSIGEPPSIYNTELTERSKDNLRAFYFKKGWFDVKVNESIDTLEQQKIGITYEVVKNKAYIIDSLSASIASPVIEAIHNEHAEASLIKSGDVFNEANFIAERERLTGVFRNKGIYHFSSDYISFKFDTIGTGKKVNTKLAIEDRIIRNEDSVARASFKPHRINKVRIFTDSNSDNRDKTPSDSLKYRGFVFYSYGPMKYRPQALSKAIFIKPDSLFSDIDRSRTYRYLNELQSFKYPNIEYQERPRDSSLLTSIYLSPRPKYGLGFDVNVSQSNIQAVGFSFSGALKIRNLFRGSETLEISAIGAIGSSKDGAESRNTFFDINEIGTDLRLIIPRFVFPFYLERLIPNEMTPVTRISGGYSSQTNIGLDKQSIKAILNYSWKPSDMVKNSLDLVNVQYVRNLNPDRYFRVYQNSFSRLEQIAVNSYPTPGSYLILDDNGNTELDINQANEFINLVVADDAFAASNPTDARNVRNIKERKTRLTQNNLIIASNFSYTLDKREDVFDPDYSIFKGRIEFAGNLLNASKSLFNLPVNANGEAQINNVAFSQYVKTDLDYIKHWSLGYGNILAFRAYGGVAIPLGNSSSIPFSKSYFAGGTNDNRAWTAYNLGPGKINSPNEFNEANMKLAFNLEHRYDLFGSFKGAFFIDAGNIWNVQTSGINDPDSTFDGFKDLADLALGSGFGIRYDISLFAFRFDIGFKTYEPSILEGSRWFKNYNFSNAVYNIGINYPF